MIDENCADQGLVNGNEAVQFYDAFGRQIVTKHLANGRYDLSGHATGIYFVKVGGDKPAIRRIVKID